MTPRRVRRLSPHLVEVAEGSAPAPVVYAAGHAGAGARWAIEVADALPAGWGVRALLLPGREARATEPFATRLADVAARAAEEVELHHPPGRPAMLYGQSLGALLAFELCRALERGGRVAPAALAVLGAPAPGVDGRRGDAGLEDDALLRELEAYGTVPPAVLDDAGLRERILAVLRADLRLFEGYAWGTAASLAAPLTALRGRGDATVGSADVDAWAACARSAFARLEVEGGHLATRAAVAAWTRAPAPLP